MNDFVRLREQLIQLVDKLFILPNYGDNPEIQNTIDELKEYTREITNYIKNPHRFNSSYLSSIKIELNQVVIRASHLLQSNENSL